VNPGCNSAGITSTVKENQKKRQFSKPFALLMGYEMSSSLNV